MLELNSPVWDGLTSSPGGTGTLTARLLQQAESGDKEAYWELYHQVCHQFSVGEVAYVAVPHLVHAARSAEARLQVRALSIVGAVAAARLVHPENAALLRDEWRADYLAANNEALRLAAKALQVVSDHPSDTQELLATVAALQGQTDWAMFLFTQAGLDELSCPACGEPIKP